MTKITLTLSLFMCAFWAGAQINSYCGTVEDENSIKFIDKFLNGEIQTKNIDGITWVPMTIHLVSPTDSKANFDEKNAMVAFCQLNEDFQDVNIQFYLSSFEYINSDNYYNHDFSAGIQMMNNNNVFGTANSYFVASAGGACGYFAPSGGAVALTFSCSGPASHTWAHEMGHYFSLPHTFRGWEGEDYEGGDIAPNSVNGTQVERVENVDNCDNQADRFCDTPADYLSFRWNCNNQDESPITQTDPDSIEFRSDGTYFMSYSNDGCMNRFSPLQMEAMVANLENTKPQQIDSEFVPTDLILENTFGTYPINSEIVTTNDVLLQWEEQGDAIGYYLEISTFSGFNFPKVETYVEETSFLFEDMKDTEEYYWRITPYNRNTFCSEAIEYDFVTNVVVANENTLNAKEFFLSPNPSSGAFYLMIDGTINGDIAIYNTHSQLVHSQQIKDQSKINLDLDLPAGIYILQIDENGLKMNKKFIVQ